MDVQEKGHKSSTGFWYILYLVFSLLSIVLQYYDAVGWVFDL